MDRRYANIAIQHGIDIALGWDRWRHLSANIWNSLNRDDPNSPFAQPAFDEFIADRSSNAAFFRDDEIDRDPILDEIEQLTRERAGGANPYAGRIDARPAATDRHEEQVSALREFARTHVVYLRVDDPLNHPDRRYRHASDQHPGSTYRSDMLRTRVIAGLYDPAYLNALAWHPKHGPLALRHVVMATQGEAATMRIASELALLHLTANNVPANTEAFTPETRAGLERLAGVIQSAWRDYDALTTAGIATPAINAVDVAALSIHSPSSVPRTPIESLIVPRRAPVPFTNINGPTHVVLDASNKAPTIQTIVNAILASDSDAPFSIIATNHQQFRQLEEIFEKLESPPSNLTIVDMPDRASYERDVLGRENPMSPAFVLESQAVTNLRRPTVAIEQLPPSPDLAQISAQSINRRGIGPLVHVIIPDKATPNLEMIANRLRDGAAASSIELITSISEAARLAPAIEQRNDLGVSPNITVHGVNSPDARSHDDALTAYLKSVKDPESPFRPDMILCYGHQTLTTSQRIAAARDNIPIGDFAALRPAPIAFRGPGANLHVVAIFSTTFCATAGPKQKTEEHIVRERLALKEALAAVHSETGIGQIFVQDNPAGQAAGSWARAHDIPVGIIPAPDFNRYGPRGNYVRIADLGPIRSDMLDYLQSLPADHPLKPQSETEQVQQAHIIDKRNRDTMRFNEVSIVIGCGPQSGLREAATQNGALYSQVKTPYDYNSLKERDALDFVPRSAWPLTDRSVITDLKGFDPLLTAFAPTPIDVEGVTMPTLQHAFTARCHENVDPREFLRMTAKQAADYMRDNPGNLDDREKVSIMHTLSLTKFSTHPAATAALLRTNEATLINNNGYGDTLFGRQGPNGTNHAGRILMEIRHDLRQDIREHPERAAAAERMIASSPHGTYEILVNAASGIAGATFQHPGQKDFTVLHKEPANAPGALSRAATAAQQHARELSARGKAAPDRGPEQGAVAQVG
jgi:predicted NAD-dependent protein-ADP-ribosyltransferase YbiA (DUF1768 family)